MRLSPRTSIGQTSSASSVHHIPSSRELFTQVSGREASETASVSRRGTMEPGIAVNGVRIGLMVRVALFMSMEISMTDIGPMTRPMVAAFTSTLMVPSTRACGRMTCSTGTELRPGQTSHDMKVITPLAASMALAVISGTMVHSTQVTGVRTRSVE